MFRKLNDLLVSSAMFGLLVATGAWGSPATWVQTTDADFHAGTKTNLVVTGTGIDGAMSLGSDTFSFRREITIDNTGGAELNSYQLKVVLTGLNFDFSKTRPDGADIRFCDSDGFTPLNYWIEAWDPSAQTAALWVNVPSIEAGTSKTIHMYYGNPSAADESNGSATFDLFDDFDDLSAWSSSGGAVSVTDGIVTLDSGSSPSIWRDFAIPSPFIVEVKYQHPSRHRNRLYLTKPGMGSPTGYDYGIFDPSIYWNGYTGVNLNVDTWYIIRWENTPSNYIWRILNLEGTEVLSRSHGSAIGGLTRLSFAGTESSNSDFRLDWVRIRKYSAVEPSVTVGAETPSEFRFGIFVSPAFDTDRYSNYGTISWDADVPSGTALQFHIRTGETESELLTASWNGPTGTTDYYTVSGSVISAFQSPKRWVQYKAFFGSTGGEVTPVLRSVSIEYSVADITIESDTVWSEGDYRMGSLTVRGGATLTIAGGSTVDAAGAINVLGNSTILLKGKNTGSQVEGRWAGVGVTINAANVTVESGSKISADGQGYTTGNGPGGSSDYAVGGTYGGRGSGSSAPPYGSATAPVDLGSAGGGAYGGWSAGGGAIRLNVSGLLLLDGEITADGTNASGGNSAGGAGGSIYVTVGAISGSGKFTADGGGGTNGGKGGGGRIAVYYGEGSGFSGFATTTVSAGGSGAENGTVFFLNTTESHLKVSSQQLIFGEDTVLSFGSVTIENGATLILGGGSEINIADTLAVTGNSTLVLQGKNRTGQVEGRWAGVGVTINAANVTVESGSKISADGQGYTTGNGPGGSSNYSVGGTHGGRGTSNNLSTYGSPFAPTEFGSAGGGAYGGWSAGGGAIRLNVSGLLFLDGEITADGTNAKGGNCAGGAGGSIYLNVGTITGNGKLTADGGPGNGGGTGGGGRIAIYYWDKMELSTDQITAAPGGSGATAGTIYITDTPVFRWVKPSDGLLHDVESLAWEVLAVNPSGLTAEVFASRGGNSYSLGKGLPAMGEFLWNTGNVPDGIYELRAIFKDALSRVVGEATINVMINNSVLWHSGRITSDETWTANRVHVVEGDVFVSSGVRLTVEPGTVVKFAEGTRIIIENGGILEALGTADLPIVFTSLTDDSAGGDTNLDGNRTRPIPGYWYGFIVQGSGQLNLSDYVSTRYIKTTHSGTLAENETWLGSFVHHVTGDVTVPNGVTLTIEAGAVVKFDGLKGITVKAGGSLIAEGNVAQPVYFTSVKDDSVGGDTNQDGNNTVPGAGDWRWIYVNGGEGIFDHVHLSYGGGTSSGNWDQTGMIKVDNNGSVTISNSVLREAFFDGVLAWGGPVTVTNSVLTGIDRGICAHPGSPVSVINCTLDDNRIGLLVHGGTLDVANTIVTNSIESGIQYDFGTLASVRYSNVWTPSGSGSVNYRNTTDRTGTDGNISADPKYKNREQGNYRLSYRSPCIDAADGSTAPDTDFMGAPRYDDPRTTNTGIPTSGGAYADMGAFEFVETADSSIDLVVSSIHGPSVALAGEGAEVSYEVANLGSGEAVGPWHNAIALVNPFLPDEQGTIVVGDVLATGSLGPGESKTFTAIVSIPGGTEGGYLWEIQVNARGEVFEGANAKNNTTLSEGWVTLRVPELKIGEPVIAAFKTAGKPCYYKLKPSQAGSDIAITLDRADASGWTEIFVGCGRAPTDEDFCARSSEWNRPDATVLIENATNQWYYLMLIPRTLPSGAAEFTLSAQMLEFALTSIGLTKGSNTGQVVIPIHGAKFRPELKVWLVGSDSVRHEPLSIFFDNPTLIYAVFDLRAMAPGLYDVHVELNEAGRTLATAFEVVSGTSGELETRVSMPEVMRVGRESTAWIEYRNTGETTLLAPIVSVESPTGAKIKLRRDDDFVDNQVAFQAISMEGPPGLLGPGQSGRIAVYVLPLAGENRVTTRFAYDTNGQTMDWDAVKNAIRPPSASPQWDAMWDAEIRSYGNYVGDYVRLLSDAATLRWLRTGARSPYIDENLRFLISEKMSAQRSRLSGYVYLDDLFHPAGGVWISAVNERGEAGYAVSDGDGLIRLEGLTAGTYTLRFIDHILVDGPDRVTIPETGEITGQSWIVSRGATIFGRVHAPAGTVFTETSVLARSSDGSLLTGALDPEGGYSIVGVPDGTYRLSYTHPQLYCIDVDVSVENESTVFANDIRCEDSGSVSGRITDGATGDCLAGIVVAISDGDFFGSAVSGTDGTYRLTGIRTGHWTIVAYGEGYRSDPKTVEVLAGHETSNIDFVMYGGAELRGNVKDGGNGSPVSGAYVWVLNGSEALIDEVMTDSTGDFHMSNLPSGTFTVKVEHYLYPSALRSVNLSAGSVTEVDITLSQGASISGAVTNSANGAGLGAIPLLLFSSWETNFRTLTDKEGGYIFSLLDYGEYGLMFPDGSHRQVFSISSSSPNQVYGISLNVGSVSGRVLKGDGITPAATALVHLVERGHPFLTAPTKEDGRFLFPYVVPGTYDLLVTDDQNYFETISGVEVDAGAETEVPTIVGGTSILNLTFQDKASGSSVGAGGKVSIALKRTGLEEIFSTLREIGADGTVSFTGLVPGTYRFLTYGINGDLAPEERLITIGPGTNSVTVFFSEGGIFKGKVQDGSGIGLPNFRVVVFNPVDGEILGDTITDPTGQFSVLHIPPGTYSAVVFDPQPPEGGDFFEATYLDGLEFSPGQTLDRTITPALSTTTVSGAVVESSASPPWPANVKAYDRYGIQVGTAQVDGVGEYTLRTLSAGAYTLRVDSTGFSRGEQSITLQEGMILNNVNLSVEWRGIFADPEAAPEPPIMPLRPAYPKMVSPLAQGGLNPTPGDFWKGLDVQNWLNWEDSPVFNNQISNAITRFLEWVHNKPRAQTCYISHLAFPAECSAGCPNKKCPPACCNGLKWQRAAILYQKWANQKYSALLDAWQPKWTTNYANIGKAGTSLLKLAGTLLGNGVGKAWGEIADEIPSRVSALSKLAAHYDQMGDFTKAGKLWEEVSAWQRVMEKGNFFFKGWKTTGALTGGMSAYDFFIKKFGEINLTSGQGILDFLSNILGLVSATSDLSDLFKMTQQFVEGNKAFGIGLGDLSTALGTIGDALSLGLDLAQLVKEAFSGAAALAQMEKEYQDLIGKCAEASKNALNGYFGCYQPDSNDNPIPEPPPFYWPGGGGASSPGKTSIDPNVKITVGYDNERFIGPNMPILYTIFFENMATATAPAQQVVVTDQLSDRLEWSTVELVGIGFNQVEISVPPGLNRYQTTTAVPTDPNPVRVTASLDPDTGVITWVIESVDLVTGGLPEDPLAGFLPPNKPECDHCGEGYVSFIVWPKTDLLSGDTITNKATIVFDVNPPIDTPEVVNTIDNTRPTSLVLPLPEITVGSNFLVKWSGSDNPGGSGLDFFDLYVSVDGGPFSIWISGTSETSATFHGEVGHRYGFYSVATDHVGNRQVQPSEAQASTTVTGIEVKTVLLEEDFSSGIPESWFVAGAWSSDNPCGRAIGAPFIAPWAVVDSSCQETSYELLQTPVFDASLSNKVSLRMSNRFDEDSENAGVLVGSNSGGTSWIEIRRFDQEEGPQWEEIDLGVLAGTVDAQLGFEYSGTKGYWAIDNLRVVGEPPKLRFYSPVAVTSEPQPILITNRGEKPLTITGIEIPGSTEFSIQNNTCVGGGAVLDPDESCSVDVVYTPATEGTKVATLEIVSTDAAIPIYEVELTGKDVISLVHPDQGTLGTQLTLKGSGFGAKKGKVLIGGMAVKVVSWTGEAIGCEVNKVPLPPAVQDIVIQRKEPKGAPAITIPGGFEVKGPEIVWLDKIHGKAGDSVTLVGKFFGTKKGKVFLGTKSCKVVTWTMNPVTGHSEVVFVVPKGLTPGAQDLTISNKVGSTTMPGAFRIDTP